LIYEIVAYRCEYGFVVISLEIKWMNLMTSQGMMMKMPFVYEEMSNVETFHLDLVPNNKSLFPIGLLMSKCSG